MNPFSLREILENVRRWINNNPDNIRHITAILNSNDPSARASAIGLLHFLKVRNADLFRRIQLMFDAEFVATASPQTGFSLVANGPKSVAEAAWEYLHEADGATIRIYEF